MHPMSRAIVLAPGPGLDISEVEGIDDPSIPLVAINAAIAVTPRADAWVALDPYSSGVLACVWMDYLRMEPRPVHRMNASYAKGWEQEYRVRAHPAHEEHDPSLFGQPYRQDLVTMNWITTQWLSDIVGAISRYTVFSALAHAIERHGATDVDLYGASMSGWGYCLPKATDAANGTVKPAAREKNTNNRWARERESMRKMVAAAKERGVEIRVHSPTP